MNRQILTVVLACLTAVAGCAQTESGKPGDAALRELVGKYVQARNSKDAEATRSLFTPDADQLVSTGEWRKGIDALVKGAMASSHKEAAKSSITIKAIRFIEPDVAIVDGRYETVTAANEATRKMWTTLLMKRIASGWRIAAIRNMLPAPNTH